MEAAGLGGLNAFNFLVRKAFTKAVNRLEVRLPSSLRALAAAGKAACFVAMPSLASLDLIAATRPAVAAQRGGAGDSMERGSLRPRLRHHRSFAAFAQYASLLHHARSLSAIITTRLSRSPAHADLAGAYPRRFARSLRRRFAAQLSHKHIGHGGSRATAFFVRR